MGALPDSRKQRAQHPATTKLLEREAVPDVALVLARRDGQLDLADPFGLRREPTVSCQLIATPRPETAPPPRHPRASRVATRSPSASMAVAITAAVPESTSRTCTP